MRRDRSRDRARPPAPLVALLCAVAIVGVAWGLLTPPWQAPDENSHFGYVQNVGESFELPGDAERPIFSTEQQLAAAASNAEQTAAKLHARPEWSRAAYERWRDHQDALTDAQRADGGGLNPAASNPPLYYFYETPAYLAAAGGDVFDRLYLMRLWSVLLLMVTTAGTWLLAGELFGRRGLIQLVAASFAGLQPMVTFMTASVNPDGLLFALWTLALWLGARMLKRGLTAGTAISLCAVVGLAVVTKSSSYALVPGALLALAVSAARLPAWRVSAPRIAIALAALVIPIGAWLVTAAALDRPAVNTVAVAPGHETPSITSFDPRELGSYLWQFYLPRLPFQRDIEELPGYPAWDIWHETGWGAFGWLEVRLPSVAYTLLGVFTVAVLASAIWFLWRRRRALDPALVAFFGLIAFVLLAGLHWTEFRTLVGGVRPFNQGRYVLPLIGLWGAAVATIPAQLPARWRAGAAASIVGALFVLQALCLAVVVSRFYA